jgi:hypothetical protein
MINGRRYSDLLRRATRRAGDYDAGLRDLRCNQRKEKMTDLKPCKCGNIIDKYAYLDNGEYICPDCAVCDLINQRGQLKQRIAELEKAYTLLCKAHSAYTPVRWQDTYNKYIELATPQEAKP